MRGTDLNGRVAMVTGGAGSIGAATCLHLAERGAAVAVGDVDEARAADVAADIIGRGGRAVAVGFDVADETGWADALAKVEADLGVVDLLHSNAALATPDAIAGDATLGGLTVEYWDSVMSVNLRGAMLGCRHVIPFMQRAGRGSIVITSSIVGLRAKPGMLAYASSKAALIGLARGVAAAHGRENIRCNVVAPGPVESRNTLDIDPQLRKLLVSTSMIPRFALPEDIAKAVAFLLSDDSAMVTGHVLVVDGGVTEAYPSPSPSS